MSKIVITTASNPVARSNLDRSIVAGIPLASIDHHPSLATLLPSLRLSSDGGRVRMWGSVAGEGDRHRTTWERVEIGDWIAFWVDGGFQFAGRVSGQMDNPSLADLVWEPDPALGSYRYITFFDAVSEISVSATEMSDALGYRPAFIYRGFFAPAAAAQAHLAARHGDVETFLQIPAALTESPNEAARKLVAGLIGVPIRTVTGRPNTVLEIIGGDVLVATDRSPEGQRVPLEWVEEALSRLLRDGRVEVSVDSLGHRSAFVGAVLLTLPGATATNTSPPYVVLGPDVQGATPSEGVPGSLGMHYRSASPDERREAPDPFTVDPALVERGLRSHALVQNSLAAAVESAGLEPRSPQPTEPNFDLAWMRNGVAYVAEVKSVTDLNEERQLRLGIGQVLRYRDLLRMQGHSKVQAVLVPARNPRDPSWRRLCDELEVTLTVPPAFEELDL